MLALLLLLLIGNPGDPGSVVSSFTPLPVCRHSVTRRWHLTQRQQERRLITRLYDTPLDTDGSLELPLLDLSNIPNDETPTVIPLPSSHLPDELTTGNVYGLILTIPLHQMVIHHAMSSTTMKPPIFGHVAYRPQSESLVGAIGCASQILLKTEQSPEDTDTDSEDALTQLTADALSSSTTDKEATEKVQTLLCRGFFRFRVTKMIKSIPFPIAIVEEYQDEEPGSGNDVTILQDLQEQYSDEEDDEEDDDEYIYADLAPSELIQRTLRALKDYTDQQLANAKASLSTELSPLEQSILEDSGMSPNNIAKSAEYMAAEEAAAVFDVFQSSLLDLCPTPTEQYFTVAFMAAEMANLSNFVRRKCLVMTDGLKRLRYVLQQVETQLGMERARKLASGITDQADESEKDLQVGQPTLPPWAKQIRKGMRLEYYWNEEYGWCQGEVVEEPLFVVDEVILTVYFESDGTTHRLPFSPDEKVRWRPAPPPS